MNCVGADTLVSSRHVHLYGLTWAGYFALLSLLPVKYGTLEAYPAIFGMSLWVVLSTLTAYVVHQVCSSRTPLTLNGLMSAGRPLRIPELERLIRISLGMATVGFLCLCFDRIVLQGIDFSQGIAVARHLWRASDESRQGVSSIFSVLGYLLGFAFFVATTLAHLHWEMLTRRTRWSVVGMVALLVALNSLLTGGRSIVLIQLACVVAVGAIRSMQGLKMLPGRGARIWIGASLAMVAAVGYSLYVFSERAAAGNSLPERYVAGMLWYLGGSPTEGFYSLNVLPESVAAIAQFATVAGAYLTHSYGTFESVLEMQSTPGSVSFGFIRDLLAKLGIGTPAEE
jgi:hypothetical protein